MVFIKKAKRDKRNEQIFERNVVGEKSRVFEKITLIEAFLGFRENVQKRTLFRVRFYTCKP